MTVQVGDRVIVRGFQLNGYGTVREVAQDDLIWVMYRDLWLLVSGPEPGLLGCTKKEVLINIGKEDENMDAETRGLQAYFDLFKLMTGLDLTNPDLISIDPTKITVSKEWEQHCVKTVKEWHELDAEARTFFSLTYMAKMPNISETQEDQIKFSEGYAEYREVTADAGK